MPHFYWLRVGAACSCRGASLPSATSSSVQSVIESLTESKARSSTALVVATQQKAQAAASAAGVSALALTRRTDSKVPKPKWHAPWKLMRVISGHNGWVRSVAVEPGNEWFVTGAADRTIKVTHLHVDCVSRSFVVLGGCPHHTCASVRPVWWLDLGHGFRDTEAHSDRPRECDSRLGGVAATPVHVFRRRRQTREM
jgi:WD40 repeat protein